MGSQRSHRRTGATNRQSRSGSEVSGRGKLHRRTAPRHRKGRSLAQKCRASTSPPCRKARSDHRPSKWKTLGCTHAQVGAYLMSIWGLPVPLVRAVAFHQAPVESGETQFSSLTAVHVADVHNKRQRSSPLIHDAALDMPYLDSLALSQRLDHWRTLQETKPVANAAAASVGPRHS